MEEIHDPERENPESVAAEVGVQGIEALPTKIDRYGKAKKGAIDVADYMAGVSKHQAMAEKVRGCGDYLSFRHYFTIDKVRLHGASLCKKHLLCPLCAIRRGAKSLKAYLDRFEVIKAEKPELKPFLVTLTVKDGDDLAERFEHLHRSQRELWKRKQRGRGSVLDGVVGAVWSYEIKRGSGSGLWHPHLHMIALSESIPDAGQLAAEWKNITLDSHVVDVRPIDQEDPVSGFIEVFKYAVKFSDQTPADTVHAWEILAGKRLLGSAGCFRGVEVPESLLDDPEGFEGLPYIQLFYRFLPGGYSLAHTSRGVEEKRERCYVDLAKTVPSEKHVLRELIHDRLLREKLTVRRLPGGYKLEKI
jgi:Replication protein